MEPEPLPAFCGLIGRSPGLQALVRRIERVAPLDVAVLILGESGTGKELVATAIHQLSGRRAARFEAVNCGGLTRELLRSELFGHERGAFTGAVERRPGLLPAAHGGTVFFDEVGELAPDAQATLLRFLADGEVRPVGASRSNRVDVRVVAATHRDLAAWADEGRFRDDLYFRLRRVVLHVPPLRARPEDLPLLVEHCRRRFNARHHLDIEAVSRGAMLRLTAHPWPGNVRELEAVLEEAMIFCGRGQLGAEDLALEDREVRLASGVDGPVANVHRNATTLSDYRRSVALELANTRGVVTRRDLATACGVSREVARRELTTLLRLGLLRRVGSGRGSRYLAPA